MLLRPLFALVLAAAPFAEGAEGAPAREGPFRPIAFDAALEAAKKEGKVVMVDFFTTWCRPCKMLDQVTWRDEKVQAFLEQRTVPLKIDAEKEVDLARRFLIRGYPTMIFVKPDGAELGRLVGYLPPETFLPRAGALFVGDDPLAKAKLALVGHEDDPKLREEIAKVLVERREYEAALRELLWCFDHGAEKRPAYAGVRGSSLLQRIGGLAEVYPPARDALRERRGALAAGALDRTTLAREASLVARIDGILGQKERSLELYDELLRRGPEVADARDALAAELLAVFLDHRRYEDLLRHEPDAPLAIEKMIAAARKEEALAPAPGTAAGDAAVAARKRAIRGNVERLARAYHEASLGTGRTEKAERIAQAAMAYSPTGALCASLIDGAVRAEVPEAGRKLGESWETKVPEEERAAVRAALQRIPR